MSRQSKVKIMPDLVEINGEEVIENAVHSEYPQDFTMSQAVIEVNPTTYS